MPTAAPPVSRRFPRAVPRKCSEFTVYEQEGSIVAIYMPDVLVQLGDIVTSSGRVNHCAREGVKGVVFRIEEPFAVQGRTDHVMHTRWLTGRESGCNIKDFKIHRDDKGVRVHDLHELQ